MSCHAGLTPNNMLVLGIASRSLLDAVGERVSACGPIAAAGISSSAGSNRCIPIHRQQHAIRPIFTPVAPEEQPQRLNAAGQGNLPTSGLGRTAFLDTESGYSCARWSL